MASHWRAPAGLHVASARLPDEGELPSLDSVADPPLGRAGQVSDAVDGVLFLESSPYITGEILHIDGGQAAGH